MLVGLIVEHNVRTMVKVYAACFSADYDSSG